MGSVGTTESKYNGFSITDADGNTKNYRVINGQVEYASGARTKFLGIDSMTMMQKAYDQTGSVQALIDRVNSVGKAKARSLSDKEVENLISEYDAHRRESEKQNIKNESTRNRGKGVNRHRTYWSAM